MKNLLIILAMLCLAFTQVQADSVAATDPVAITATQTLPSTSNVGTAYQVAYTLTNNLEMSVTNLRLTPTATGGNFIVKSTTCEDTLAENATCTWTGEFTPTAADTDTAVLTMQYFTSAPIVKTQTTTASAASDSLTITPTTTLSMDTSTGTPYTVAYQISNATSSNAASVSITPTVSGGSFTQASTDCESSLAASTSCDWTGTFTPSTAGDNSITLSATATSFATATNTQTTTTAETATWIAVGGEGVSAANANKTPIYTTTNPSTWAQSSIGVSNDIALNAISEHDDTWIAVGQDLVTKKMAIYKSTNAGNTWSAVSIPTEAKVNLRGVDYADGKWVAVGSTDEESFNRKMAIYTSSDGNSWTSATLPSEEGGIYLVAVNYLDGNWYVVGVNEGSNKVFVYRSVDAQVWEDVSPTNTDSSFLSAIAYGNGKFVLVGKASDKVLIYTSTDGSTWTRQTVASEESDSLLAVTYANNKWVATGFNEGNATPLILTSENGSDWAQVSSSNLPALGFLYSIGYANNTWVATGVGADDGTPVPLILKSNDAQTWTAAILGGTPFEGVTLIGLAHN